VPLRNQARTNYNIGCKALASNCFPCFPAFIDATVQARGKQQPTTERIMANESSVREDSESNTDTVEFKLPELPQRRPMVTGADGQLRELTDYEMRKLEESKADTEMRRQAAAAQRGGSTIDKVLGARRVVVPLNTGEDAPFTVPPSINELRITSMTSDEGEIGHLQTSIGFLKSTRESLERVSTAYEALRADTTLSHEARSVKVSTAADKAHDTAYQAQHKALETIAKQIEHVSNELRTPLASAAHVPGMAELRSVLRDMPKDKRRMVIQQAIAADNPSQQQKELITAALGGHYLMAGLEEVEHQTYTLQLNQKRSPHLVRRMEQLQKSMQAVSSVNLQVLTTAYEGAQRATFRKAKTLRGISDKAQAALDAINGG
jgi:hypothetical protein